MNGRMRAVRTTGGGEEGSLRSLQCEASADAICDGGPGLTYKPQLGAGLNAGDDGPMGALL